MLILRYPEGLIITKIGTDVLEFPNFYLHCYRIPWFLNEIEMLYFQIINFLF